MDLYLTSLALGAVGLGVMAISGLGSHGHGDHGLHGDGHAGHIGDAGHAGHGGHHVHTGDHGHAHAPGHGHHTEAPGAGAKALLTLMSPRVFFSCFLGFGTAGMFLRSLIGGPMLVMASILGAIVFERVIVTPLWNLTMRFASTPASTLESAIADDATAVTAFDGNGQGIVSIELDGQVVQILATLQTNDRLLGTRIRAGQRLRIEEVDAATNRCTVSLL